jgi:hypothetical protein
MRTSPQLLASTLADHYQACSEAQAELDRALWLTELDATLTRRQAERVSDGAFALMGIGMLVVTLAAVCAACASLGGAL